MSPSAMHHLVQVPGALFGVQLQQSVCGLVTVCRAGSAAERRPEW